MEDVVWELKKCWFCTYSIYLLVVSLNFWEESSGKKLSVGTKKINNIQNKFKCEIKSENVDA